MYFLAEVLILGFAAALIYFSFKWGARRWGRHSWKPVLLSAALFVVVFMGEEIAGSLQMRMVCPTAKVEVYGSVELPAFFYGGAGEPLFIDANGAPDYDKLFGPVALKERLGHYLDDSYERHRRGFINEHRFCFREKKSHRELACANHFTPTGGWPKELINVTVFYGESCGPVLRFEDIGTRIVRSE